MAQMTTPSRSELLRRKIEEKRRLEKDSLRAVEALLETGISEENLIEHCRMMWQQSYQDCTEERAISRLCGYPLCDNPLAPEDKKSPQYKICTRTNKVFSLDNRRSFCSAWCYKASEWVKRQLSEVPFWMLEQPFIKPLELLKKDVLGKAVNVDKNDGSRVGSIHHQARPNRLFDVNELDANPDCIISRPKRISIEEIDQCAEHPDEVRIETELAAKLSTLDCSSVSVTKTLEKPIAMTVLPPQYIEQPPIISVVRLEALLCEWITITTLHHILGQDRFLEIRAEFDKGKDSSGLEADEYALKYERLCRFLDEQDKLEGTSHIDGDHSPKPAKPIKRKPKRGLLKKVKFPDTDPKVSGTADAESAFASAASASAVERTNRGKAPTTSLERVISGDLPDPVLPPVDKHDRNAARKQILLERLTPVADKLAPHLQTPPLQLSRDLSELIDTFHLTKDNCMLKPKEALVVFMVTVMLIDRRAGGEGTLPEVVRANTNAALNAVGLSWGDLRVAISKATNPKRLFR